MNVVVMEHAKALADLGHEVELVTRRDSNTTPEATWVCDGVTVRQVAAGPAEPLAKSAQEEFISEFSNGFAALEPYDLVHSHHWMSGVAAIPVAKSWGVPHVQSFHSVAALPGRELSEGEPPESPGRNEGERFIAQHSDQIVAVSEYEARTIVERCGARPERVTVVNPGVDVREFRPLGVTLEGELETVKLTDLLPCARDPRGRWPRNGYALFAARLQPLKGPELALRAIAATPAKSRPDLVITGDVSQDFASYREELHGLARELGISEQVRWCGPRTRSELATLMRGARVMLVPSFSETFGLVALEANASGTPVIASNAGGLSEAIVDGKTGTLMDSRDPHDWAKAIAQVTEDWLHSKSIRDTAREHALRMSWEQGARALSDLYFELRTGGHS